MLLRIAVLFSFFLDWMCALDFIDRLYSKKYIQLANKFENNLVINKKKKKFVTCCLKQKYDN